jgi:hypothetical protein
MRAHPAPHQSSVRMDSHLIVLGMGTKAVSMASGRPLLAHIHKPVKTFRLRMRGYTASDQSSVGMDRHLIAMGMGTSTVSMAGGSLYNASLLYLALHSQFKERVFLAVEPAEWAAIIGSGFTSYHLSRKLHCLRLHTNIATVILYFPDLPWRFS